MRERTLVVQAQYVAFLRVSDDLIFPAIIFHTYCRSFSFSAVWSACMCCNLPFAFILSTNDYDTSSATPRIVAFVIVSGSLLKFASITYALSGDLAFWRSCCDTS